MSLTAGVKSEARSSPEARPGSVVSPGQLVPFADFGPLDRLRGWVMTLVITALAAITRFLNLGSPTDAGTPIFDEKHYAPQAWQMLHNHGVEDNPAYGLVVHPPVGKQLIALGEAMFGYTGLGWRFAGAVCGTVMVLLIVRIARRITRSTLVGGVAGLLLIADGMSFVTARTALLDVFLTVFVVAAFGALIVDRDQVRKRMHVAFLAGRTGETRWGPRLGVRWWRFGAGVLLGLACGTKWSGLYFVLFFGAMSLAFDVAARKQYRVARPWRGTLLRDTGPTLYAMVLAPFAVYLGSYAFWFASETGVDRYQVGRAIGPDSVLPIPDALRSLWHYTHAAYTFHAGLTNAAGNFHPWESKPWVWPMSLRPVLYAIDNQNVPGCGAQSCVKAVMLVGTPAMWFVAVPVLVWAVWRTFVKRDWRYAVALTGYSAGFLPWFADIDRQMYFFYASTMAPFLVLMIALILGDILHKPGLDTADVRSTVDTADVRSTVDTADVRSTVDTADVRSTENTADVRSTVSSERRTLGLLVVCMYLAVVITNFAWMYPILTGLPISQSTWNLQIWLPSWR